MAAQIKIAILAALLGFARLASGFQSPFDIWYDRGVPGDAGFIAYGNGKYVVIQGFLGSPVKSISTSPDLVTWRRTEHALPSGPRAFAFKFLQGKFYLATDGGLAASEDGIKWNFFPYPTAATPWGGVAYGNGLFVVAGDYFTFVSADGTNWTYNALPLEFSGLCFGKNKFVAISPGATLLSVDGVSWEKFEGPVSRSILFTNDLFVGIGGQGIAYSTDGISWNQPSGVGTNITLRDIAATSNLFVAVGPNLTNVFSTNGIDWQYGTWSSGNPPSSSEVLFSICSGSNGFAAIGDRTAGVMQTVNGLNWRHKGPRNNTLYDVVYADGRFVTVGSGGTVALSSNAVDWSYLDLDFTNHLRSVTYGNGRYVAVRYFNPGPSLVSTNGTDWIAGTISDTNLLLAVRYCAGQFIAVGANGTILTSSDGLGWAHQTSPATNVLWGVAYGNGTVVMTGFEGVFTSLDGTNWIKQNQGSQLGAVDFLDNMFLVHSGPLLASNDGTNWISRPSTLAYFYYGLGFGNGTFVTRGGYGPTLVSTNGLDWVTNTVNLINQSTTYGIAFANGCFVSVGSGSGTPSICQSINVANPFLSLQSSTNKIALTASGEIGRPYRLQASPDLLTWSDLLRFTNMQATIQIFDTNNFSPSNKFYRAVSP